MEEGGGGGRALIVPRLPHKLRHTDQARHGGGAQRRGLVTLIELHAECCL